MRDRITAFLKRSSSRDVFINTLGNYLNTAFTAFFVYLLVRILNPAEYGVLSVLLGIAYVLSNILDFGVTATIYSYLPTLIEEKSNDVYQFMKSTFFYQSLFSSIVIGILFITFPFLDRVFFKTRAPIIDLYLTAISVLFFIWQNFMVNCLFAAKRFLRANVYINLSNFIKLAVLLGMVYFNLISVGSVIFVYGVVGQFIFFVFIFFDKKSILSLIARAPIKRKEFRFRYTLTYFAASQFFNLGTRMDLFLLSYFQLGKDIGFYGLSQKIILSVLATIVSITQVLSPGFSRIKNKKEALQQFKHGFLYLLIPTVLFIILTILPAFVFSAVFTEKFVAATGITHFLSVAYIPYALGNIPWLFVLYAMKKPIHLLISNLLFFVIVTAGSYILIPTQGVYGPPIALFFALLIDIGYLVVVMVQAYKKLPTPTLAIA